MYNCQQPTFKSNLNKLNAAKKGARLEQKHHTIPIFGPTILSKSAKSTLVLFNDTIKRHLCYRRPGLDIPDVLILQMYFVYHEQQFN